MSSIRTRIARLALAGLATLGLVVASATAALADGPGTWNW